MNKSLSVVLPIHNAQASLTRHVEDLLDVLADLTSDFQIVIVDDASTDSSAEVAAEFSSRYPQIIHLSNRERMGVEQAIDRGRASAHGEMVFVHDGKEPMKLDAIIEQCRQSESQRAMPDSPKPIDDALVERLMHWGDAVDARQKTNAGSEMANMSSDTAVEQSVLAQAKQMVSEGRRNMRLSDPRDTHHVPAHLRQNRREIENREKQEFWF